jgi:hypothetical protein
LVLWQQLAINFDNYETPADRRFREYHEGNPHVYAAFCRSAMALIAAGRSHYGAKAIFEKIRFDSIVSGNDEFKINNNYVSRYARKFGQDYPAHAGFFRKRELKT